MKAKKTAKKQKGESASASKKRQAIKIMMNTLCNITEVCEAIGIDRTTFYNWKAKDENFAAKVADCYEHRLDVAEQKLMEKIGECSETSIIFFLKTQGKKRGYVERSEVSASVEANVNEKLCALSDDELAAKLEELKKKLK